MTYFVFIDESGHCQKNWRDEECLKQQPRYILTGYCIHANKLSQIENFIISLFIEKIGDDVFASDKPEIKGRSIIKGRDLFHGVNTSLRKNILNELFFTPPRSFNSFFISIIIDKYKLIEKYGDNAKSPYELSSKYLMERLELSMKRLDERYICIYDFNSSYKTDIHDKNVEKFLKEGSKEGLINIEFENLITFCFANSISTPLFILPDVISYIIDYAHRKEFSECDQFCSNSILNALFSGIYRHKGRVWNYGIKYFP